MESLRRACLVAAVPAIALGGATAPTVAQTRARDTSEELAPDIVVTGYQDIVVNGRARRCTRASGDPLDQVDLSAAVERDPHSSMPLPKHMAVIPDAAAGHVLVPNFEQVTGPEFWQRVGVRIDRFVFRAPSPGRPMCIGGRGRASEFAGFRRIVGARPYRGQRLRFTAWVATGRATQVNFWLAAGTTWRGEPRRFERTPSNLLLNGGNSNDVRFGGNHGWTPVLLETGPIHQDADHVSYGFNLAGSGDVWVFDPQLEVVAGAVDDPSPGDLVVVIGRADD